MNKELLEKINEEKQKHEERIIANKQLLAEKKELKETLAKQYEESALNDDTNALELFKQQKDLDIEIEQLQSKISILESIDLTKDPKITELASNVAENIENEIRNVKAEKQQYESNVTVLALEHIENKKALEQEYQTKVVANQANINECNSKINSLARQLKEIGDIIPE